MPGSPSFGGGKEPSTTLIQVIVNSGKAATNGFFIYHISRFDINSQNDSFILQTHKRFTCYWTMPKQRT